MKTNKIDNIKEERLKLNKKTLKEIQRAKRNIKKGKFYTYEEVKKLLRL